MTAGIEWPAADEVARAIIAASLIESEDPVLVAEGGYGPRVRVYTFLALTARFPRSPRERLAAMTGHRGVLKSFVGNARAAARNSQGIEWFEIGKLHAVQDACGWPRTTVKQTIDATLAKDWVTDDCHQIADVAAEVGPSSAEASNPEPDEAERVARVERMKAFAAGEPSEADEVVAEPAADPVKPEPKAALPALIPSKAARDIAKFARARRVPVRGERALTISYTPDAPAEERGCELHTAEAMGDPPYARSALFDRQGHVEPEPPAHLIRHPDEVFVERWQGEEARKRNEALARPEESDVG